MDIYLPLDNKYYKWYLSICNKTQKPIGYCEHHHIIPECLGGSREQSNMVYLTAREHLICHWLLTKCYEGIAKQKMIFAFNGMCSVTGQMKRVKNSRIYEVARKLLSELQKKQIPWNKGMKKEKPPKELKVRKPRTQEHNDKIGLHHKGKIVSLETREKLRQSNLGKLFSEERKQKLRGRIPWNKKAI